jgi:serine/threonine protein kinase
MPSLIRPKPEHIIEDDSVEHSLIIFPIEIWLLIAHYLTVIEICNLLPVNRLLRSLAKEGAIWTIRCGIVVEPPGVTLHRAWVLATHHVYTAQDDLQFMGDGNHCRISGRVDKVKRSFGNDGLLYARKSILIREQKTSALATSILLEEAKKILRAKHSHVVKIAETYFLNMEHDYGDNAVFSIIMERADGNLDAYLTGMKPREEMGQLASWFGCLIRATAHIHGRGIPHQSIKPSNILVKNERLLLADFGISKVSPKRLPGGRAPGMDRPDEWPRYFSAPEAEGLPADIFSLGAVFLEMLVAHSCPLERQELVRITGVREYYSYADRLAWVHVFMDQLSKRVSEKWCLEILAISKSMLHEQPSQRPLANKLNSAWSSSERSDLSLVPCTCPD